MNMGGKPEDKSTHNPSALPAVTQAIVVAKGVTDPLIQSMRKFGENNFKAGNGRLGFGPSDHDFRSNLTDSLRVQGSSVIPGAVHRVQACFAEMMMKFAIAQKMFSVQSTLPASLKSGIIMLKDTKDKSAIGSINEMVKSGRADKVMDSFLKNPVLNCEDNKVNYVSLMQKAERLQSDNLLKMVLNHQQVIEELLEQNMKLREIMVEDLKISPTKLQGSRSLRSTSSSPECFGNHTGTVNKSAE